MKNHSLFLLSALVFSISFFACEQDDIITTETETETTEAGIKISGNAFIDVDFDGNADIPAEGAVVVYVDSMSVEFDNIVAPLWDDPTAAITGLPHAYVDSLGNYTIDEDLEVSAKAVWIFHKTATSTYLCQSSGVDNTLDGDPSEAEVHYDRIHVTLTEEEHDTGNDFLLKCY